MSNGNKNPQSMMADEETICFTCKKYGFCRKQDCFQMGKKTCYEKDENVAAPEQRCEACGQEVRPGNIHACQGGRVIGLPPAGKTDKPIELADTVLARQINQEVSELNKLFQEAFEGGIRIDVIVHEMRAVKQPFPMLTLSAAIYKRIISKQDKP